MAKNFTRKKLESQLLWHQQWDTSIPKLYKIKNKSEALAALHTTVMRFNAEGRNIADVVAHHVQPPVDEHSQDVIEAWNNTCEDSSSDED